MENTFFSIDLVKSSKQQLEIELKKIKEVKEELLSKENVEEVARLRDWEKMVTEAIQMKT